MCCICRIIRYDRSLPLGDLTVGEDKMPSSPRYMDYLLSYLFLGPVMKLMAHPMPFLARILLLAGSYSLCRHIHGLQQGKGSDEKIGYS